MVDDVGEPAIKRDEDAALAGRYPQQCLVWSTDQALFAGEHDIVTGLAENRSQRVWNVLIELDRGHIYAAGIGTMVSRASSAA